jgi:alkyldihydroxyacetonephosphate synthase
MSALTFQQAIESHAAPAWAADYATIVGADHVLTTMPHLVAYSRDRLPYATYHLREGKVPATLPLAIVCPANASELAQVVKLSRAKKIPLIPFGAGSGVLGGTLPLDHEIIVDLKRLNQAVELNETDACVTVQAGMNGGQFEAWLNERNYTCGHFPQSLHMSTVGGWAACRGAGQNSSRFGKIEDMVVGLTAILPDGEELRVRPVARRAVGPSVKDLMVGSEGVLGIITELTLRVWKLPQTRYSAVIGFPSLPDALTALRRVMQAELRPSVVRLYDEEESRHRGESAGIDSERPIMAMLEFSGVERLAAVERDLAMEIVAAHGGKQIKNDPYQHWLAHRFESYSPQWQSRDYFMDTIEVTGAWSQLPEMYARIRIGVLALAEGTHFGTHWSHVYAEGACQYMTFRLPPMDTAIGLRLHHKAWEIAQSVCLELGGSISHHHGSGVFRNPWMEQELGGGLPVLQAIKDHLDPDNLFVPGKLGLRPRAGAVDIHNRKDA